MPTHDAPDHPLATILRDAFAPQLESGEVDLVIESGQSGFEIQADEWTLHLEGWPVSAAFIALDEEPVAVAERKVALDAALDNQHLAALRQANASLHNALSAALENSGDMLSALLADLIAATSDDETEDDLDT